jgi:hypothetical protein
MLTTIPAELGPAYRTNLLGTGRARPSALTMPQGTSAQIFRSLLKVRVARCATLISPEVLKPIRRPLGVPHGVLDVPLRIVMSGSVQLFNFQWPARSDAGSLFLLFTYGSRR